jgi:hypothetical protein
MRGVLLTLGTVIGVLIGAGVPARAGDPGQAALAAALQSLDGMPASDCADGGLTPTSGRATCLRATPDALAGAEAGLVLVQASINAEVQPFIALMGVGPEGIWGLWFAAPATFVPTRLPAEAKACHPDGVSVFAEPSRDATVAGTLTDGSVVSVDRFVLARFGAWSATGDRATGEGWFHIAGSGKGWVPAGYIVVAEADCGAALGR